MRVLLKEYAKSGRSASEMSDDGGEVIEEWTGPRKVGERICAFVEVACDDTDRGVERLLDAMAWLTDEIKRRKGKGLHQELAHANSTGGKP